MRRRALLASLLLLAACDRDRPAPAPPPEPSPSPSVAASPIPSVSPTPIPVPTATPASSPTAGRLLRVTPATDLEALSKSLKACDVVEFAAGTYAKVYVHGTPSGRADCPITYRPAPGAVVTITGAAKYGTHFNLFGSYYVIEGLRFENTNASAVINADGGDGHVIEGNRFKNNTGATFLNIGRGKGHRIKDNVLDRTGSNKDAGSGDALYLRGTTNALVAGNRFKDAGHYAIDVIEYAHSTPSKRVFSRGNVIRDNVIDQCKGGGGIGVLRGSTGTLVEGNVVRCAGGGVAYPKTGIQVAGSRNIVRRNVVLDAARDNPGLVVFAYGFAGIRQDAVGNVIEHNTIARSGGPCFAFNQKTDHRNADNLVRRNLCIGNRVAGAGEKWRPPGLYDLTIELFHSTVTKPWGSGWAGNKFVENWFALADGAWPLLYRDEPVMRASLSEVDTTWPEAFSGTRSGFVALDADGRPAPGSAAMGYGAHAP